jgi:hypothetical protein
VLNNKKIFSLILVLSLLALSSCKTASEPLVFNKINVAGNNSINIQYAGRVAYQEPYLVFSKNGLCLSKDNGQEYNKILNGYMLSINVIDDWIYFVQIESKTVKWFSKVDVYTLYKCKTDGSKKTKIIDDCGTALVYKDTIYYTKHIDFMGYSHADPDIDSEKMLIESNTGYLFSCDLNGNNEVKLTNEPIYDFCLDGNYIYYTSYNAASSRPSPLKRINIDTKETESLLINNITCFCIENEDIYFSDGYNVSKFNINTQESIKILSTEAQIKSFVYKNGDVVFRNVFDEIYCFSNKTNKITDLNVSGEFIYIFNNDVYCWNNSANPQKLVL